MELREKIAVLTSEDFPEKSRLAAGEFIRKVVPKAWDITAPVLRAILTAGTLKELGMGQQSVSSKGFPRWPVPNRNPRADSQHGHCIRRPGALRDCSVRS